ncbi:unnamed protein product [Urochloa decumbens]|uniref:DUF1618 domain-containing protein n=1 Tax=Urochloa decumbens TaxID=240449 RepID=A0ABC9GV15_9POAL
MRKYRSRSPSPSPSPPRRRRQTHPPAATAPMDTDATQPPSVSPAAASSSYPPWVLLENQSAAEAVGANSTGDAKTLAAGRTSAGNPIRVSVRTAAPPAESRICVQVTGAYACPIAAHGDSVLITVGFHGYDAQPDYFVYSAGAAAAAVPPRPPSLFLLPPCYHVEKRPAGYSSYGRRRAPEQRYLNPQATGLVRRGEDDFVVALLTNKVVVDNNGVEDDGSRAKRHAAELLRLRNCEWSVTWAAISDGEGSSKDGEGLRLSSWQTHSVVSVGGDGLLCFVQFGQGLMFTNVFDETPAFRHVPFPPGYEEVDPPRKCRGSFQDVCATSDGTVKLVSIYPRCCCGSSGATHCLHSNNAYTIKTWTLKMDDMEWEMDGMVDGTELWALDAYKCLPRVQLAHPIVSLDEPHVIFFVVCEGFYKKKHADETEWFILVDTRSKTIRSVYRYGGQSCFNERIFLPSSVSHYFNSSTSGSDAAASSVGKRSMGSEPSPLSLVNKQLTNNLRNLKAVSPEEKILATLQEVPGLSREEVLKAYSILNHDSNGRRFRSLLGLPVNMRKDWLLMEIKSCEACSFCSTCTANSQ